jgi:hypothetical protein
MALYKQFIVLYVFPITFPLVVPPAFPLKAPLEFTVFPSLVSVHAAGSVRPLHGPRIPKSVMPFYANIKAAGFLKRRNISATLHDVKFWWAEIYCHRFFVGFDSPFAQMSGQYRKVGYGHFTLHPFQFCIVIAVVSSSS